MFTMHISNLETMRQLAFTDEITRVVSIVDSSHTPEHHIGFDVRIRSWWHVSVFDDIDIECQSIFSRFQMPTHEDISAILSFTDNLAENDTVLVHCHGGTCRSPAVAMLLLVQHGMSEKDALSSVLKLRPTAWPNNRVLEIGDEILGSSCWSVVEHWKSDFLAGN